MLSNEVKGKKLTFLKGVKPLPSQAKWGVYDDDLEMFMKSEDDVWDIVVPKGVDAKELRTGLRGRVKTKKFKGKITVVSKTENDKLRLQLQKV